jgi:hypothetical protein
MIVSANKATLGWLHNDTDFDSLREHPRFRALAEGNPEGGTAV